MRPFLTLAGMVLLVAWPAAMGVPSQQAATPVLSCQTISDRTSLADLKQRFGDLDAENRRLEITWADTARTRMATLMTVDKKSAWKVNGIAPGMAIAELELVNGRSFLLRNFNHENGGAVLSWTGGKLEPATTDGCRVAVRMAPSVEEFTTLEWKLVEAILSTADVTSDDRRIKPYKTVVAAVGLDWR